MPSEEERNTREYDRYYDRILKAEKILRDLKEEEQKEEVFKVQLEVKYQDSRIPIVKPSWTAYFIGMALLVKERSADGQTKHGTVICNNDHIPIGIGYNSFPRGKYDDLLPNLRPDKYFAVVHSEVNAVANCSVSPRLCGGAKAYISGVPCLECLKVMHQNGITHVYHLANRAYQGLQAEGETREILIAHMGIQVVPVEPDLSWLKNINVE